jgi:AraC-like DNA-binding protein
MRNAFKGSCRRAATETPRWQFGHIALTGQSPQNQDRIIACRDDRSPEYAPEKVELPVKESSFVQVGRGEHIVDVQIATVGNIGLTRLGIGVEAIGVNVLNTDYIGFALPVSWSGELLINGEHANKSDIYMSGDLDSFHLHSKTRVVLGVTFPRKPFIEAVAALSGAEPGNVLLKARELRLSEVAGAEVRTRLTAILNEACDETRKRSQREISNDVLGLLTDAYLHALPGSFSQTETVSRPERVVRLAEERFMMSDGKPVSLADLCAASGVGKSALYKAFHRVCGLPPLAYFQKRRLMQARSLLVHATNERGQVKHAALSAGFTELGRFAVEYRQLFGEPPSATLNRTRS